MSRDLILGWLTRGSSLVLIGLVAWELADWSWRLVVPEVRTVVEAQGGEGKEIPDERSQKGRGVERVRGLFGGAGQGSAAPPLATATEAPVTRLNARLLGILYASDNSVLWRALISGEGIPEGSYGVGERIGPAVLVRVEWDRVVLELQGRLETLRLPKLASGPVAVENGGRNQVSAETQALIGTLWRQFEKSPESILENIRIEPVFTNGQFRGVQLLPGRDPNFLQQFGVQSGDVVTWVNGVELTDPMKGMAVLGSLGSAQTMQFTVQRGRETLAFEFSRK
ncbi:MAG: hypothetical protein HQL86_04445 [Magnetococcales bacterium]|nr:hypothetical protein [Magnetococcales bacterium]